MNTELLLQNFNTGVVITFIGMATVLFFLTLMIFVMRIMEKIIFQLNKFFPEEIPAEPKKKVKNNDESELAAAIPIAFAQSGGNK